MAQEGEKQVEHKLNDTWSIHWQRNIDGLSWGKRGQCLCSFDTVEKFWACWEHVPKPLDLFRLDKHHDEPYKVKAIGPDGTEKTFPVSELKVFRANIPPKVEAETEDGTKLNNMRIRLEQRKPLSNKFMAELWERTVLAIIGESLENAEHINGFVISGSKINRWFLEAWLGPEDREIMLSVKAQLNQIARDFAVEFNQRERGALGNVPLLEYTEKNR